MAGGFLAETNTMEAVRDAERCRLQHSSSNSAALLLSMRTNFTAGLELYTYKDHFPHSSSSRREWISQQSVT